MKECSSCARAQPLEEFVGRYGGETQTCETCRADRRARFKRHRAQNPDVVQRRQKEYRHGTGRARYLKNNRAQKARIRAKHPEKIRRAKADWREKNRALLTAKGAARRARKLKATPAWADLREIAEIYKRARLEGQLTGKPVHVDHVVPLQHKLVCGLHCGANLAIVEGTYNFRKSNRTWPDMP